MTDRPNNCRNALRDAGKPYPRSGCAVCNDGGLRGCPYEKPVTSDNRSEIEALAAEVGERHYHDGETVFAFTPDKLREFARRLQPARVPAYRDRVSEIEDAVAAGTMNAYQCFTQMRQLVVAAAPAAEGVKCEPVAWMTDSVFVCRSITEEKDVADMWLERGWNVFPLGVIDHAEPTPDSHSPDSSASRKHDPWCSVLSWAHSSSTECDCSLSSAPAPESREVAKPAPDMSKSWPERDYMCVCSQCGASFIGWKRQAVCKSCSPEAGPREGVEEIAMRCGARLDRSRGAYTLTGEQLRAVARRLASAQQASDPSHGDLAAQVIALADEREAGYKAREHGDVVNGRVADKIVALAGRIRSAQRAGSRGSAHPFDEPYKGLKWMHAQMDKQRGEG